MALFSKNDNERFPVIVIATDDRASALYTVARGAEQATRKGHYELEIRFKELYEPTVESTLRILHKVFGWSETDRGTTFVKNLRCYHKFQERCNHPTNVQKQDLEHQPPIICTEDVRGACPLYVVRSPDGIPVTYVRIEQAGGIRDM